MHRILQKPVVGISEVRYKNESGNFFSTKAVINFSGTTLLECVYTPANQF
jgi:hypothetical protein